MADGLPPPSDGVSMKAEQSAVSDLVNASPVSSNSRPSDVTSGSEVGATDHTGKQEANSNTVKPSVEQLLAQGTVFNAQHNIVLRNQYGMQVAVLPLAHDLHQMQQYPTASISGSATMTGSTASCIVTTGGTLATQPLVLAPLPSAAHFFMPNGASAQSFLTLAQPQSQGTPVLQLSSSAITPTIHQHTTCVLTSDNGQAQAILSSPQQPGGNGRQVALTNNSVTAANSGMQVLQQSSTDDVPDLEDLERFAKHFKRRRIELGFTQGDVGTAMGKIYSNDFSQTTISRFEALNLSIKNMCKLKPLLEKWLQEVDPEDTNNEKLGQLQQQCQLASDGTASVANITMPIAKHDLHRRRKRTNIDNYARSNLERSFIGNPKPSSEEIAAIAESLAMEPTVVRIWFCNRRQKERRINPSSPPGAFVLMSPAQQIALQGYVPAVSASAANGLGPLNTNSLIVMHQNSLQSSQGQELLGRNAVSQPSRLLRAGPLSSGTIVSVADNRLQQQSQLADVRVSKDNLCSSLPSSPLLPAIASMAALSTNCFGDLRSSDQQHQFLPLQQQQQEEQDAMQQASTRESVLSQDSSASGATASDPAGPAVTS